MAWTSVADAQVPALQPACSPGVRAWCACPRGEVGESVCNADGLGWSGCSCAPRLVPLPGDTCKEDEACAEEGRCTSRGGRCVAATHDACRASALCIQHGRCVSNGEACVAGSAADCALSKACGESGECRFDDEQLECNDGTERRSTPAMASGIVALSLGAVSAIVGAVVIASAKNQDAQIAGGTLLGLGGLAALGGLPLLVYGAGRVPRAGTSIVVSPASVAARVDF